jgi:hypothetical protein
MFGEYLDAFPGRWLVWNGGGPLGPRRYACREHRGDLVAYLRYHYATVAAQVWKMPPYQARWPDEKRPHMGGSMGIIKFGLRGGLLQDRPSDDAGPAPASTEPSEGLGPRSAPPLTGDATNQAPDVLGPEGGEAAQPRAPGHHADAGPPEARLPEARLPEARLPEAGPPEPGPPQVGPPEAGLPEEDGLPPGERLGADEWYPSEGLFPPGELFLPTDGPFATGAGSGREAGDDKSHGDDPAWPRLDGSSEEDDDDGPWPASPESPPV